MGDIHDTTHSCVMAWQYQTQNHILTIKVSKEAGYEYHVINFPIYDEKIAGWLVLLPHSPLPSRLAGRPEEHFLSKIELGHQIHGYFSQ